MLTKYKGIFILKLRTRGLMPLNGGLQVLGTGIENIVMEINSFWV